MKRRLGQECHFQRRCYEVWIDLSRCAIEGRNRRCTVNLRLAARMLTCAHVAVACHLLAAGHLRLCHRSVWQAGQSRD